MNPSSERVAAKHLEGTGPVRVGTRFTISQTFSAYKTQGRTGIKVLYDNYVVYAADNTGIYFTAASSMNGPTPTPGRQTYYMSLAKWQERVGDGTILID